MNTIHVANLSVLFVPAKFLYEFLKIYFNNRFIKATT